jgi:hypothetical protein
MLARKTSLKRSKSTLKRKPFSVKSATGAQKKKLKKTNVKKADAAFSKWIRERDGKCVRCGKTEHLQCSHFWPRAASRTRFDPENCDTLCYGCHYGDRYHGWEYSKQGEYRDFKIKQLGEEAYKKLEERYNTFMPQREAIDIVMNMLSIQNDKDLV